MYMKQHGLRKAQRAWLDIDAGLAVWGGGSANQGHSRAGVPARHNTNMLHVRNKCPKDI